MNLDRNICEECAEKNFKDTEYNIPLKMCNDCYNEKLGMVQIENIDLQLISKLAVLIGITLELITFSFYKEFNVYRTIFYILPFGILLGNISLKLYMDIYSDYHTLENKLLDIVKLHYLYVHLCMYLY